MNKLNVRAWDINRKKMYYFDMGVDKLNLTLCYNGIGDWNVEVVPAKPHDEWLCGDSSTDYPMVLLQSTLFEDKNKKEIYKGDIVMEDGCNLAVVDYGDCMINSGAYGAHGFHLAYVPKKSWDTGTEMMVTWGNLEVIGNIYENPELLERSEHE